MRLFAMTGSVMVMLATGASAEKPEGPGPVGISPVSYTLVQDNRVASLDLGFETGNDRDLPFDMGRPEGSGTDLVTPRRAAKSPVRLTQTRAKKLFNLPWQTGVFQ
jgi:hypothetical protein